MPPKPALHVYVAMRFCTLVLFILKGHRQCKNNYREQIKSENACLRVVLEAGITVISQSSPAMKEYVVCSLPLTKNAMHSLSSYLCLGGE